MFKKVSWENPSGDANAEKPPPPKSGAFVEPGFSDLQKDFDAILAAYTMLSSACEAAIECRDVVLAQGTRSVMMRVIDLLEQGLLDANMIAVEILTAHAKDDAPFCTVCQTHLTEASQSAGYCLKCNAR